MAASREFRLSIEVFTVGSRESFLRDCRRAERLGYDAIYAADHLGAPAPFPALAAAAAVTERIRVGTLVLKADFWNMPLLAREVATLDRLSGGRFEFGLGAGNAPHEYAFAGIERQSYRSRVERLASAIGELRGLFAEGAYEELGPVNEPAEPVQRGGHTWNGPPLIIGGSGKPVLRLAAAHADMISVIGRSPAPGGPPGTFRLASVGETERRLRFVREQAGPRAGDIELHTFVHHVELTRDRRAAAEELVGRLLPSLTVDEVLESPYLLLGTAAEIAGQLHENRARFGFSHVSVHRPFLDQLAPVIELLRRP